MDPALLKQQAAFKARAAQALELARKSTFEASSSHTTYEYVFSYHCCFVHH